MRWSVERCPGGNFIQRGFVLAGSFCGAKKLRCHMVLAPPCACSLFWLTSYRSATIHYTGSGLIVPPAVYSVGANLMDSWHAQDLCLIPHHDSCFVCIAVCSTNIICISIEVTQQSLGSQYITHYTTYLHVLCTNTQNSLIMLD